MCRVSNHKEILTRFETIIVYSFVRRFRIYIYIAFVPSMVRSESVSNYFTGCIKGQFVMSNIIIIWSLFSCFVGIFQPRLTIITSFPYFHAVSLTIKREFNEIKKRTPNIWNLMNALLTFTQIFYWSIGFLMCCNWTLLSILYCIIIYEFAMLY